MPPIRWYVNLKPNMSKHQGPYIRLVAKIDPPRRVDADCVWQVAAAGGNTNSRYLAAASRGRYDNARTQQIRSAADRYGFKNTFHLPHVGGDRFRLSCHLDGAPGNTLFTQDYETWRKFYYTLHYMNDACKQFWDRLIPNVKAVFERANIELVEYKRVKTLKDEPNTLCDSNVRLTHLYRASEYPFVHKPHHMRIVVVNDVYDGTDTDLDFPDIRHNTDVTQNDAHGNLYVRHRVVRDNDDWVLRLTFGADYGLGNRWARGKIQVTTSAHAPAAAPRPAPVVYPDATYDRMTSCATLSNNNRRVEFRFKSSGPTRAIHKALSEDATYGDRKIRLEMETRMREHYCGHKYRNVIVIRINETGTMQERQTTVLQTMVHEMGHGFDQVKDQETTYDGGGVANGVENNAQHYTGHGGQGPHCNLNAHVVGGDYVYDPTSGGDLCVMYHCDEDHVDANGNFCANCAALLKRVDLGVDAMKTRHWDISYE